jgi:hypothetical protein
MPAKERVVAIEEHFWIPELRDRYSGPRGISAHTPARQLDDLGEVRLRDMDAAGIDSATLSAAQHARRLRTSTITMRRRWLIGNRSLTLCSKK